MQKSDYFGLVAGVNITDSPFFVKPTQATDNSYNYDYVRTGAISKRRGHMSINTTADSQVITHGLGLFYGADGTKTICRAGGTKFQTLPLSTAITTNIASDDSSPVSDFFSSLDTSKTLMSQFNNGTSTMLWALGGGQVLPYGYNGATAQPQISTLTRITEAWTTGSVTLLINNRTYTQAFTVDNNTSIAALATLLAGDTDVAGAVVDTSGSDHSLITITGKAGKTLIFSGITETANAPIFTPATTQVMYPGPTITQNGVKAPTGNMTAAPFAASFSASFPSTGTFYFAVSLRKASTQAESNASLDVSVKVTDTTQCVKIIFPTGIDTTKYDQINVYGSTLGGSNIFTTGNLLAQLASNTASFLWDGQTTLAQSQNIPRPGSLVLDNSTLDTKKSYKNLTVWKNRLITSSKNVVYLSDLLKSESWPINNNIVLTSGGDVLGLGTVGFNTPTTSSSDEKLCIWKEEELWEVTGNSISDWDLKFVDVTGCPSQSLVVKANGAVFWLNTRGIFMWYGAGKPVRLSRPIESLFASDGDLDKSKLTKGFGVYYKKQNQIIWVVSHKTYGENAFAIKLDLRLTMPQYTMEMIGNEINGIFSFDTQAAIYAGEVLNPAQTEDEVFIAGDNSGKIKQMYLSTSDDGAGISYSYSTPFLDMGIPNIAKRFKKIVVWMDQLVTTNKLTLQYWSDYRSSQLDASEISVEIGSLSKTLPAIWDLASWDDVNWDDSTPTLNPVVFNLNSIQDNNEGDCLRLRLVNSDADTPVVIHGITVFWDEMSVRK